MKNLYFLWYYLNWLEFVTYILIPSAIILIILVYIFFNIKILKLSYNFDIDFLDSLDKMNEKELNDIKLTLKCSDELKYYKKEKI